MPTVVGYRPPITAADIVNLRSAIDAGEPLAEAAERFDLFAWEAELYLRGALVPVRRPSPGGGVLHLRPIEEEVAEQVRRWYARGWSINRIRKATRYSHDRVCRLVGRAPPAKVRGGAETRETVRAIRGHVAAGVPHKTLATQYGISERTVHNIAHRKTWAHLE